jgi:O-antigen/teichoic acid export membrane protein
VTSQLGGPAPTASGELARSVGLLGFQRVAVAALGVIRTKITASLLGPAGMGLLAQAISLQDLLRSLAMLGSQNGFLKLVAQHRGEGDLRGLERLLASALFLYGGLAIAIAATCALAAAPIARAVFDDPTRVDLVVAVALSLLFLVPGVLVAKVFAGVLDYRSYALLAMGESLIWVVAMAGLARAFGLSGAVWSLPTVELVALLVGAALLHRRVLRPLGLEVALASPAPESLRRLLRLASALALTSLTASAATLFVRSEIVRSLGSSANGHYQVAWQVGQNYLAFLGAALWGYGMPRIANQLSDPDAIVATQNEFLRIALVAFAPGLVILLVTRGLWIPVLFTDAFLVAGTMLCWQLAGELAAMLRQTMNISLLPRERLGFLILQGIAYWSLWALVSCALLGRLGALAAAVGYLVANVVMLIATYAYHRQVLGFRIDGTNRRLLASTLPMFALATGLALSPSPLVGIWAPIGLVALWGVVHRADLRPLTLYLTSRR